MNIEIEKLVEELRQRRTGAWSENAFDPICQAAADALQALSDERDGIAELARGLSSTIDKLTERFAALSERNGRLEEALGQISRMRLFPDHAINQTTLSAAINIARDAISPVVGGGEEETTSQSQPSGEVPAAQEYSVPELNTSMERNV